MNQNDERWDLVVIGGGITGAGILREAVRNGLKTLLIEQKDFAWGTSSRSSKLVHGGLRYLKEGHFGLTRESVKERNRLIKEAQGLVEPLAFHLPVYEGKKPGKWTMGLGLTVYDLISMKWNHGYLNKSDFLRLEPHVEPRGLKGGFVFQDAQVDDARLVMRLVLDAEASGGRAMNYTRCSGIARNGNGRVEGVVIEDVETGEKSRVNTSCVVNATGVWAEKLHPSPEKKKHIRPLRGSHLVFPAERIPVSATVSFFNPEDGRALFAIPWAGAVLVGTTDLDHNSPLNMEPRITEEEANYLVKALRNVFLGLSLRLEDAFSSFAGVRPVVSEGNVSADKESRDHVIWKDKGLVTVTGGKLTTFRVLAYDALNACVDYLPGLRVNGQEEPVFESLGKKPSREDITGKQFRTLWGRYGKEALTVIDESGEKGVEVIPGTDTLGMELDHAVRHEKIRHLDDLMLRRVRIGLLLEKGGMGHLERIRPLFSEIFGWDDERWNKELKAYASLWESCYSPQAFMHRM
jgi:glycerol-3-phosphate dehydrogenase